ncbi:MAG: hypothetical protein OEM01_11305 [Desulfobulbaceae bacterium]|nr:hypothetical protein [Desulfobulbaceae bacterium]
MKYFHVVCVLGFLLMAADSFAVPSPGPMIVSGTNDPLVNGTYKYNGDYDGKPSWVKGNYFLRWGTTSAMTIEWSIGNSSSGQDFYRNANYIGFPSEVQWTCLSWALDPCTPPVVTADPLPEKLFVSGTVDAFLNGEYVRGLNSNNGYPRYAMGNYDIHVESAWTNPWVIEKTDPITPYYTTPSYGASVPEAGWSADAYASGGPDYVPPVVTAYPLPQKLYVSGTVDEFLNGEYVRGLNGNGCPLYSRGDFVISRLEWTAMIMGEPWSLEDTSTGNIYYDSYDESGIKVPEKGWFQGPYGGLPISPPVMSAARLPDKYKVRGAGSTEVNGVYTRTLNSVDGLVYEKEGTYYLEAGYYYLMAYGYGINKSAFGTYYSVESDSLNVPSGGWILGSKGTANPPYVTPYFPWPMFMPSFTGGGN